MFQKHLEAVGASSGDIAIRVNPQTVQLTPMQLLRKNIALGLPQRGLPAEVNDWRVRNLMNLRKGVLGLLFATATNTPTMYGVVQHGILRPKVSKLSLASLMDEYKDFEHAGVISFPAWAARNRGVDFENVFYGVASFRVVTTAGVNFIVDAFQDSVEMEIMRYHGIGSDNTAEAVGDTALNTEFTTELNPNSTRATGSLTEGGSANVYRTVGTNTVDSGVTVEEHGILSQAATGGGTLFDRSLTGSIALSNGDSIQSTYDGTFTAGS